MEKEGMEEMKMSSSSMSKNASDNNIENFEQTQKNKIKFGGWLPDCLDWFKRPELAQSSLPTSSYTMNRYCWPKLHRKMKPKIIRCLTFSNEEDDEGNLESILSKDYHFNLDPSAWNPGPYCLIPIADTTPPEYITGFEYIKFQCINEKAFQFMQKIRPLLKEVEILFYSQAFWGNPLINPMMELLAPITNYLKLAFGASLNEFNRQFPNYIYGIQSIYLYEYTEMDLDLIIEWLQTLRDDGKPKMIRIIFNKFFHAKAFVNKVKKEFSRAIERANFMINISLYDPDCVWFNDYEDFIIENKKTEEILELDFDFLFRYQQKGCEKTSIQAEYEEQFLKRKENTTLVTMNDDTNYLNYVGNEADNQDKMEYEEDDDEIEDEEVD